MCAGPQLRWRALQVNIAKMDGPTRRVGLAVLAVLGVPGEPVVLVLLGVLVVLGL